MSWKKILFLFLSFVFVFGGVFGFGKEVMAAQSQIYGVKYDTNVEGVANVIKTDNGTIIPLTYVNAMTNANANDISKIYYYNNKTGKTSLISKSGQSLVDGINNNYDTPEKKQKALAALAASQNLQDNSGTTYTINNGNSNAATTNYQENAAAAPLETADKAANDAKTKASSEVSCGSGWETLNPYCWLAVFVNNVILRIAALVAGVSGLLFDKILDLTVLDMATNLEVNKADGFINIGWKILRDIVNIMFIFVLLYIGIMTIVKGFESGTSKMIATVITVALLINFSLFFTKIIIDASNIVAVNFYSAIKNATNTEANGTAWQGIAAVFIEKAGMGNIFAINSTTGISRTAIIIQGLGGSALLIVLALVIFIASIMFITRYIILMVVLIASSAAIGSWILPSLKKSIYDKWWSALIGQAFFAPVFFLFLYITLLFIDKTVALNKVPSGGGWVTIFNVTSSPGNSINVVLNYCLIIGSFVGTIIISKSLSSMAGGGAGKITSFMGGAAMGAVGFAGRQSLGRLGQAMNSEKMQERARNGSKLALLTSAAGSKMKKSSFDPRNAKGAGALLGSAGISGKDGVAANKGGVAATDKKWKSFKEDVRGTYTNEEITAKENAAVEKDIKKNKDGAIATAQRNHEAEVSRLNALEEEEKKEKAAHGKADKTEQDRIEKRLAQIQKEKEVQVENVKKAAEAQKEAEKAVRKKVKDKYKASKSDKDKVYEAAKKAAEAENKDSSEEKKPDTPKK